MSAIDQYKHRLLGFIECPSSFDIIHLNSTRKIAIYELLEDIPDEESDFDGKIGDILLGGGSGEAAALRISIPEAVLFFFTDWTDFASVDDLCKAFWTPSESYVFGDGYSKLGWELPSGIELWISENLCILLLQRFKQYEIYRPKNWHAISNLAFFDKDLNKYE